MLWEDVEEDVSVSGGCSEFGGTVRLLQVWVVAGVGERDAVLASEVFDGRRWQRAGGWWWWWWWW